MKCKTVLEKRRIASEWAIEADLQGEANKTGGAGLKTREKKQEPCKSFIFRTSGAPPARAGRHFVSSFVSRHLMDRVMAGSAHGTLKLNRVRENAQIASATPRNGARSPHLHNGDMRRARANQTQFIRSTLARRPENVFITGVGRGVSRFGVVADRSTRTATVFAHPLITFYVTMFFGGFCFTGWIASTMSAQFIFLNIFSFYIFLRH